MSKPTASEFADAYIVNNLTFEQILQVPGVMRLVKNARWADILEAYELANPPHPQSRAIPDYGV